MVLDAAKASELTDNAVDDGICRSYLLNCSYFSHFANSSGERNEEFSGVAAGIFGIANL